MKKDIILTGIIKDKDQLLIVRRSLDDTSYPGAWEFPGGHLDDNETIKEGLKRELFEEIGFDMDFEPIITNYTDELKVKNNETKLCIEIDFIINVNKEEVEIKLSNEHIDFKWVTKDSEYLDDYIKSKLRYVDFN